MVYALYMDRVIIQKVPEDPSGPCTYGEEPHTGEDCASTSFPEHQNSKGI